MHGKVHVWYMTEDERLEYIKKHPIRPYEKPKGAEFSNISEMKGKSTGGLKMLDKSKKNRIHELYIAGKSYREISKSVGVSFRTVQKYIATDRQKNPEKWPTRN